MKYYYIPLLIILLSLVLLKKEKFKNHKLEKSQGHTNIKIFNDNYDAKWMTPFKGKNNPDVNDFGIDRSDFTQPQGIFTPYLNTEAFQYLINEFNKKDTKDFKVTKGMKNINTNKYNLLTWKNKYDYNPNKELYFNYTKSSIKEVNLINKYFIDKFNDNYKNAKGKLFETIRYFKFIPFFIYKYKINLYKYKNKEKLFHITVQLLTKYSVLSPQIFIIAYTNNNKVFIKNIDLIGYENTADILIRPGLEHNYQYFNTINSFDNQGLVRDIPKQLKKRKEEIKQSKLKYQYACFNKNPNIWKKDSKIKNFIIRTNNKLDCENKYNWYGQKKPVGIWDRPCSKDEECPYYKSNKNYTNSFGKCLKTGYCQIPINMLHLGYHNTVPGKKPMCYNCSSKEWLSMTPLGDCCEEQKDSKRYSFLKGPDYAFKNDLETRINQDIKEKNKGFFRDLYINETYPNVLSTKPKEFRYTRQI